jgi:acetyl esterase
MNNLPGCRRRWYYCENGPLRDEGEAYARKLKAAGVAVDAIRYNGTIHDFVFLNALRHLPSTKSAISVASDIGK